MTDEELRRAALDYLNHPMGPGGTGRPPRNSRDAADFARRLLELLPATGVIPDDIRADAEHVAGCSDGWCHTADESDLFDAVRRGQRVAAAWLRGNPPADDTSGPPFDAWSFVRDVLVRGAAIEADTRAMGRGYEQHSFRLDDAARELADRLKPHLRAHQ